MSSRRFTLIEILLTVAITAMVFAMVGGILLSVIRASEKITLKLQNEKQGYGALGIIRRDLTGTFTYALGGRAFEGQDETEAGQEADRLRFVTTANAIESEDGVPPQLVEVGYRLESFTDEGLVLFRRAEPYEGDPLGGPGDYVELLAGVESFQLQYLDPDSGEWQDGWEQADKLPLAVKVKLELALDDKTKAIAEEEQVEIPPPTYEMTVGLPARGALPEPSQSQAPPGGVGAGS